MGADKIHGPNRESPVPRAKPRPSLYPFPAVGGKDIPDNYAISACTSPWNSPESGQIPTMETPSSPIDSTNYLPTSPAIFSASFMDTGRWLRAAGGAAGATAAVEVERAALELKQGAQWAGCVAEGGMRRGCGRRRHAAWLWATAAGCSEARAALARLGAARGGRWRWGRRAAGIGRRH
jgi:hypothetical protein